ncbi:MAG TPA: hypothetical protein PK507_03085 [bacterium]|nr:hypothetical protein [bacterium]
MKHNKENLIDVFANTYDDKYLREKLKVVRKPRKATSIVIDIMDYCSEEPTDADDMRDVLLLVIDNINEQIGIGKSEDMNELMNNARKNYRIRA